MASASSASGRARRAVCLHFTILLAIGAPFMTASASAVARRRIPLSLVLQGSDMPAKGQVHERTAAYGRKAMAAGGITAAAAFHHSTLPLSATRYETVSGAVIELRSPGDARKVYRLTTADLAPKPGSVVRLPASGDEQVVMWTQTVSKAEILVRKGSVVWQLEVDSEGSKSQVLRKLQTYAGKQKRRIGTS